MAVKKTSSKTKKVVKKVVAKVSKPVVKAKAKAKEVKTKVSKPAAKAITKVNKVLSKSELFAMLSESLGLTRKQVASIFDKLGEVVALHLKKDGPEQFVLPGLLKIKVKKVPAKPARKGKNPFTGEMMTFQAKPASKKVKIIALRGLKDMCGK